MADVRWLDGEEQNAWRAFVTAAVLLQRAFERDLKEAHGLTMDDYAILAMLSEAPEHKLRFGELAAILRVPRTQVTYRTQRLREHGLVERVGCESDARGAYAVLTKAGRSCVRQAAPTHVASVRRHLLDHLTPEQLACLGAAMSAVLAAHSEEGDVLTRT